MATLVRIAKGDERTAAVARLTAEWGEPMLARGGPGRWMPRRRYRKWPVVMRFGPSWSLQPIWATHVVSPSTGLPSAGTDTS